MYHDIGELEAAFAHERGDERAHRTLSEMNMEICWRCDLQLVWRGHGGGRGQRLQEREPRDAESENCRLGAAWWREEEVESGKGPEERLDRRQAG